MSAEPPTPESPTAQSPPVATGGLAAAPPRRRRRLVIAAAVVVLVGGFALGRAFLSGPPDDLGRLQGEWQVEVYGRSRVMVRVAGDRWTYVIDGREQRSYRVELNPAANPREIDLTQLRADETTAANTHGPGRGTGVKMHGVYTVEKDVVRVVLRPGVEPRPTSLDEPGDAQTLTLTRPTR